MRRRIPLLAAALAVLVLAGCRPLELRTVDIEIPPHPWEEASGRRLWYNLVVEGEGFKSHLHVDGDTRALAIEIPLGRPVVVLAFPLGTASPMGGWISPETGKGPVALSQRDGLLLEAFARVEGSWAEVGYPALVEEIRKKTDDFRKVDKPRIVADAADGRLRRSSVALNKAVEARDLELPSGRWVSEFWEGSTLLASLGRNPVAALYPGEERFYCFERDLMATFVVGRKGTSWDSAISAGLIP